MKLSDLTKDCSSVRWVRGSDCEISEIIQDSRKVHSGDLFIAFKGTKFDPHDVLAEVCTRNPSALLVEKLEKVPGTFSGVVLQTSDGRSAIDALAAAFRAHPGRELYCIGVTGTNGKTTVTYLIEGIFNAVGRRTGVMGTIDHHVGPKVWSTELTTPGALELQARLRDFRSAGAEVLAMEVSSHALKQHRADSVPFDVGVFTNLSRDHLDYHSDMDDYFRSKARLFLELLLASKKKSRCAVINADDDYGQKLLKDFKGRILSFGQKEGADFKFSQVKMDFSGSRLRFRGPSGELDLYVRLPGLFNVYNAMAALAVAEAAGLSLPQACKALESVAGIRGRLERVENSKGIHVFVDFAHTDHALTNVLETLNSIRVSGKLKAKIITVFGCGGDRDRGKRPLMARAALAGSDTVFVTSDNPRTEAPQAIVNEIFSGFPKEALHQRVFAEVDRRKAINSALQSARGGDVVLIAGKGHEDYQVVGTQRMPFSDVQVVGEYFK